MEFRQDNVERVSPRARVRSKVQTGNVCVARGTVETPATSWDSPRRGSPRESTRGTKEPTQRMKEQSKKLDTTGMHVYAAGEHSSPRPRTCKPAEKVIPRSDRPQPQRPKKPVRPKTESARAKATSRRGRLVSRVGSGRLRFAQEVYNTNEPELLAGKTGHLSSNYPWSATSRTPRGGEESQSLGNHLKPVRRPNDALITAIERTTLAKFSQAITESADEETSQPTPRFIQRLLSNLVPQEAERITEEFSGSVLRNLNPSALSRTTSEANTETKVAASLAKLFATTQAQLSSRQQLDTSYQSSPVLKKEITAEELDRLKDYYVKKQNPHMNMTADQVLTLLKSRGRQKSLMGLFQFLDKDRDGWITKTELENSIKSFQIDLEDQELRKLFEYIDQDRDGVISLSEVRKTVEECNAIQENGAFKYYRALPKGFSRDNHPKATSMLEKAFLCTLREVYPELFSSLPQSHKMARALLLEMDKDVDNVVTNQQFAQYLKDARIRELSRFSGNPSISNEDEQTIKAVTDCIDTNGDGYIDSNDLRRIAETLGHVSNREMQRALTSRSGEIEQERDTTTPSTRHLENVGKSLEGHTKMGNALDEMMHPRESPRHPSLQQALTVRNQNRLGYGCTVNNTHSYPSDAKNDPGTSITFPTTQLPTLNLSKVRRLNELSKDTQSIFTPAGENKEIEMCPSHASDSERLQTTTSRFMESGLSPRLDHVSRWKKWDRRALERQTTEQRIWNTYHEEEEQREEKHRQKVMNLRARRNAVEEVNSQYRIVHPEGKRLLRNTVSYDAHKSSREFGPMLTTTGSSRKKYNERYCK
eukprot:gb/GECG01005746.1/.p1 GENE.gb/GECG01005746.1/~~gb/GECG01005746.1/.p1  ORF type:complete len:819 (+),score=108.76 gb/GECG01005746.1/:1-2457(+)